VRDPGERLSVSDAEGAVHPNILESSVILDLDLSLQVKLLDAFAHMQQAESSSLGSH